MKIIGNVFGVLLVLVGSAWFLQGVGVLPGSFMTGQTRWAVYGGLAIAIGLVLLATIGVRTVIINTVGILLLVIGGIWFLQGINVLPGSFMSGQKAWALRGGIAIAVGIAVLWLNRLAGAPKPI